MSNFDNISTSTFSTKGNMTGFILDTNERTNMDFVKAYVPKLMSNIDMGENLWEKDVKINSKCIKNLNFEKVDKNIITRNYIYLQGIKDTGNDVNIYNKGQRIDVSFEMGDLTRGKFTSISLNQTTNDYHVNTRKRIYIENSLEVEKEAGFQNKNPKGTANRGQKTVAGVDIYGNPISPTKRGSNMVNDSVWGKTDRSTAGSTYNEKPDTNQYDFIMDSSNKMMGLRMGTLDSAGQKMGDEKNVPEVFMKENLLGYDETGKKLIAKEAFVTNGSSKTDFNKKIVEIEGKKKLVDLTEMTSNDKKIKMTMTQDVINGKLEDVLDFKTKKCQIGVSGDKVTIHDEKCSVVMFEDNMTLKTSGATITMKGGEIILSGKAGSITLEQIINHIHIDSHGGDTSEPIF